MNQPIPTGPDLFGFAEASYGKAKAAGQDPKNPTYGSPEEIYQFRAAEHHRGQALTAAIVTLTEVIAESAGLFHSDLPGWREKIGTTWLKRCRGREIRRPACEERHTDDCAYADPPPEPKHKILPVGTRVLVSEKERDREGWLRYRNPVAGRISGYDLHKSKYRYQIEYEPGVYAGYDSWAFVGNHVEVHPDGHLCPPPPQPVKHEPTGPRVYVENQRGKQGYVVEVLHIEKDDSLWYRVQFLTAGVDPVLKRADSLTVIAESQVTRCDNGQTPQECTEIDPCEACQQDADEEGDKIEESMGLR